MSSEPIKDISFKESFRRARNAGLDTFTYNGKKYTTELASPKTSPKPASKAESPKAESPKAESPKAESPKAESPKADASVPSPGRYKQDTYETPLKTAARKYAPEVADNLGKIAAGAGAAYGASKLFSAVGKADKARKEAALVTGNADNAARMARATAQAEKDVAANAAKRDMFKASEERLKSGAGKAAEERLTGLDNNPRRGNIRVRNIEKNTTGKPAPVKASRTKFNEDAVGAEFRKGGGVKKMARGGGIEQRGKTKGRMY